MSELDLSGVTGSVEDGFFFSILLLANFLISNTTEYCISKLHLLLELTSFSVEVFEEDVG
jgi:hypothetical protein